MYVKELPATEVAGIPVSYGIVRSVFDCGFFWMID
jgi:hypothetical protein